MKRRILMLVPFFLLLAFLPFNFERFFSETVRADDTTIVGSVEWAGEKLITEKITVPSGATLTIKKGATISFAEGAGLRVSGTLNVEGTVREPVTFRGKNGKQTGYTIGINGGTATIRGADVSGGGGLYTPFASSGLSLRAEAMMYVFPVRYGAFYCAATCHLNVESTIFHNNEVAVSMQSYLPSTYDVTIKGSAFKDNGYDVDNLWGGGNYQNNWWGSANGPDATKLGSFTQVSPWLDHDPICTDACHSNVLFLPGIKASRLYKDGAFGTEDQLWPPNYFGNDLNDLALDSDGKSINNVYTRDVLKDVGILGLGGNIYKSFSDKLSSLKSSGTINDYNLFAYDWRQNAESVVSDGTPYSDSVIRSVIAEAETLANSSKSGQVTIVAHSNGGLVAKALMLELAKENKTFLVDTIAMVDVPQMGAPLSILALLYGYDESLLVGTLVPQKDARSLIENMPGAYGLLPSEEYFKRMNDPFVTFTSMRTRYKAFLDAYGDSIDSADELEQFLTAEKDKRAKPDASDVESENVLRKNILDVAMATHNRLDNWTPPTDVNVVEIAGWGLDTVSGVDYTEKEKADCSFVTLLVQNCLLTGEYEPVYDPKFTVDGDKVVTAPSALMIPEAENVKRYWINLHDYNGHVGRSDRRYHGDILEVPPLEQFLSNIITDNTSASLPDYIQTSRPEDYQNAKPRLRMALYSPLTINLYDDHGNHTGLKEITENGQTHTIIEENIPNSYYYQFGERKYVGWSEDTQVNVQMDGYANGSYTLKLDEVKPTSTGEESVAHTAFMDLPVTTETTVSLSVPTTGIADLPALKADTNGDVAGGEYTVIPVLNGTATLDVVAPQTTATLTGRLGRNGWYMTDVTVTLSANDNNGGSGVEKTEYSLDGSTWQSYTGAITVSQEGTTTIRYASTDKQGNRESEKSTVVKIDKVAPEGRLFFNPSTKKLDARGIDISTGSPLKTAAFSSMTYFNGTKRTIASLTDEAAHTTNLTLDKKTETTSALNLSLLSVAYDGATTTIPKADLSYSWSINTVTGTYTTFTARVETNDILLYALYAPTANTTQMIRMPKEQGKIVGQTTETLSGMVVLYIETLKGKVTVGY